MVDKDLIAAKLAELVDRVERVRSHVPANLEELQADRDALDIVAFNLMLAVQTCVDVASHVIADEGWPTASSLGDSFGRLEARGVLSTQTADRLRQAVGLRNVVAHGYAGVDVRACFRAATSGIRDLDDFAREVSKWIEAQR